MGRHLRLWHMDFPPAIALLAEGVRAALGDSLLAIRLVPALAGTGVLVLAALIARELGGGRWAQGLAALGVLASPLFLRSANLFQPVVLDQLAWTVALYALIRLCQATAPRWWGLLGLALGLGLLTKFSAAFIGLALLLALFVDLPPRLASNAVALGRRAAGARSREPEHHRSGPPRLSRARPDGRPALDPAGARRPGRVLHRTAALGPGDAARPRRTHGVARLPGDASLPRRRLDLRLGLRHPRRRCTASPTMPARSIPPCSPPAG